MLNETNETFSYFQTLWVCPKFNHEDQEKTAYFLVVLKFLVKMETFSYKSVIGDKVECSRTPACNLENRRRFYNVCRQLVISQAIHNAKEHKRQSTIGCFISIYAFGKPTKYDDSNNLGQYHQVLKSLFQFLVSWLDFNSRERNSLLFQITIFLPLFTTWILKHVFNMFNCIQRNKCFSHFWHENSKS